MEREEKTSHLIRLICRGVVVVCIALWGTIAINFILDYVRAFDWFPITIEDGAREYSGTDLDVGTGIGALLRVKANGTDGEWYFTYINSASSSIHYISHSSTAGVWTWNPSPAEYILDVNSDPARSGVAMQYFLASAIPVIVFEGSYNATTATNTLYGASRIGSGLGNASSTNWYYYSITQTYLVNDISFALNGDTTNVAFYDDTNDDLIFGTCTNILTCDNTANWTFEQVDTTGSVGSDTSLVFNSSGQAIISYLDRTNQKLKYAIRDSGGTGGCDADWTCETIDDADINGNIGTDVAVDINDVIGISYIEKTSTNVRYAFNTAGSGCSDSSNFTCEEVSTDAVDAVNTGFNSTIQGIVSWHDSVNDDIEWAIRRSDGTWSAESVVTGNASNWIATNFTSGTLGIAYYDSSAATEAMFYVADVNTNPTLTINSVAQRTDGGGVIDISVDVDDVDDDNQISMAVDYISGVCGGGAGSDPTFDTNNVTADVGTVLIDNAQTYQVGQSGGYIQASQGSNTVTFDWLGVTDLPTGDGTYCIRLLQQENDKVDITSYIPIPAAIYTSSTLTIDNVDPTVPNPLTVSATSTTSVTLDISNSTSADTNFAEYRIFFASSTPLTTSKMSMASTTYSYYTSSIWGGETATDITGLTENTLYYANLWVYDDFGNTASSTSEVSFYTLVGNPTGLATTSVATDSALISVDSFTNDTAGSSGYYFNLTKTADGSSVSTTGWTSAHTWTTDSLSANTQYTVAVDYRNADGVSATTSTLNFYTAANVPTSVSASASGQDITVSWSSDGTTCDVYNATSGSTINTSASSYKFESLSAGTKYTFQVRARNGDAVVTAYSGGVSATTATPSGAPIPPPAPPGDDGVPPNEPAPNEPAPLPTDHGSEPDSQGNGHGDNDGGSQGGSTESFFKSVESDKIVEALEVTAVIAKETIKEFFTAVLKVIDNPRVEEANEKVVAPIFAAVAVANMATAGFGVGQVVAFFRNIFTQVFLIFRRRKRKKWGVIYNGFTKQPIDLATIRLVENKTNKVIRSKVTDGKGRYFLTAEPGAYHLEVIKDGFEGFSAHLKNKDEDTQFANLYHGGNVGVSEDNTDLNYNIPLDPISEDKPTIQIIRDRTRQSVRFGFSIVGLVAGIISLIISPTPLIVGLVMLHILFYVLFYKFAYEKLPDSFGKIISSFKKKALGRVVVRVFDSEYNKLVDTTVSDRKGRYATLLGPSKYYVTYEKPKFELKKSPTLDFSSKRTQGQGGLLARDEILDPLKIGHIKLGDDIQNEVSNERADININERNVGDRSDHVASLDKNKKLDQDGEDLNSHVESKLG